MMRKIQNTLILVACVAFAAVLTSVVGRAQATLPGEQCRIAPFEKWNDQERWTWICICRGKIADFDLNKANLDKILYPAGPSDRAICPSPLSHGKKEERNLAAESMPAEAFPDRTITPEFIDAILFSEPYRSNVPREGIRINGARFSAPLDFSNGELIHPLRLEGSFFKWDVNLTGVSSRFDISFNKSSIDGSLVAPGMTIGELALQSTVIRKNLNIVSSRFSGSLDMHNTKVKCDLWADLINVDANVYMNSGIFERIVRLRNAKIGHNLYLLTTHFFRLDLSGTNITGELNTGYGGEENRPTWRGRSNNEPAAFVLRNTSAGALLGWWNDWPVLRLEDFTYNHIKIDSPGAKLMDMGSWGIGWIAHDHVVPIVEPKDISTDECPDQKYDWPQPYQDFSFQPYRQYADAIAKVGETTQADDVLFAGRERERLNASGWHWWVLTMARYLIGYGYGYRYFFALGWATLFVAIGYGLIHYTHENDRKHVVPIGVLYCVDMLLPLIQFQHKHYDVQLHSPLLRTYFVFHRVCGYLLSSFILAGLAGLTK